MEWLKRFEQEVLQLKKMSGIADDLSREEYIECIKDKLDFRVVKRLDTAFPTRAPYQRGRSDESAAAQVSCGRIWF